MIKINLLPSEFLSIQKEYRKFKKIQLICISVMLVFAFLSSMTVALRVFQSQKVNTAQNQLDDLTNKVTGFKNKEVQLLILKSRIGAIEKLTDAPSTQRSLYNLIYQLVPSNVQINSVAIGSGGSVGLSIIVPDANTLEELLNNLLSKEKNEGRILEVGIENLTRNRESPFRASLTIKAK